MQRNWIHAASLVGFLTLVSPHALAGQSGRAWKAHDLSRPKPLKVTAGDQPGQPPSDAIVLFGGSDLSAWSSTDGSPAKWAARDGYMETVPGAGALTTRRSFGDVQLHLEWASPAGAFGKGQNRGNSGVILMGKYEVQVLDSYENVTYADGQAAAVYGQHPPLVNASRPSGAWQTYDIVFRRPRFNAKGTVVTPARLTVFHNGVLVQDNAELWGPTTWLQAEKYVAHATALPLTLQDHDHPVRYRNIWLRPLADPRDDERGLGESRPKVQVPVSVLQSYVGKYGEGNNVIANITRRGSQLYIEAFGHDTPLALVPQTTSRFEFRHTAGTVEFVLGRGQPMTLKISVAENDRQVSRMP